jgi:hypothetical protein
MIAVIEAASDTFRVEFLLVELAILIRETSLVSPEVDAGRSPAPCTPNWMPSNQRD